MGNKVYIIDNIFMVESLMSHKTFLKAALKQAELGRGFCAPNPAVGAIIVKNNQILAKAYHQGPGKPHAEVEAIQQISDEECDGADLYVTLEPCCHHGRTPPCTDLIRQKKFKAVYYGFKDPNHLVAGQGAAKIQAAGIQCIHLPTMTIDKFYKSYAHWTEHKKPFITVKMALSLDGKIALPDHKPVKLTQMAADELTHKERKKADAILSTVKTVIEDNPLFNARTADGTYKKKLFLIDGSQALPLNAAVFGTTQVLTVFIKENELSKYEGAQGLKCEEVKCAENGLDITEILNHLGEQGFHDVWVEAGGRLVTSLLKGNWVNRMIIYLSPKVLGENAISAFKAPIELPKVSWQPLGDDIMAEIYF